MKCCFDFDYNKSLVALSNSFLKFYGVKTFHPSLPELDAKLNSKKYQNIVLLILDGMGINVINEHLDDNSLIKSHIAHQIYSVFPPTTTAATTAIHSGMSPLEHGWIAWMCYYKEYDRCIENFLNTDYYTGEQLTTPPPCDDILKCRDIYSRIVEQNPELEFHKINPPFDSKDGVKSFNQMCKRIAKITSANNKHKFIRAYWHDPDHTMHHFGVTSKEAKGVMKDIERNLNHLCSKLKDTLIVITADHGMVDTQNVTLNDYPDICDCFIRPPSLEARVVTFAIKDTHKVEFAKLFNKYFGTDFKLYTKAEFMASGLLGSGTPHPKVDDFIADFVAISTSAKSLHYILNDIDKTKLIGEHAGISEQEMKIPLIFIEN